MAPLPSTVVEEPNAFCSRMRDTTLPARTRAITLMDWSVPGVTNGLGACDRAHVTCQRHPAGARPRTPSRAPCKTQGAR